MTRTHFVEKARKDVEGSNIKKGESYYWWKFRFRGKQVSRTPPRPSQLTQSEFLGQIYDIEDRLSNLDVDSDFETEKTEIISDLENLRDECEERRSNMPEQLQETGSGEMLQNRYDSVQEMIDELESTDTVFEEPSEEEVKEDVGEKEADESEEEYALRLQERTKEMIEEKKQEILDEIQNVSYNGE